MYDNVNVYDKESMARSLEKNNKMVSTHVFVFFPVGNAFQPDCTSFSQTVKQRQFSKDDFHHLNVTRVASFTVYDIFDCTFECLSSPLCSSFILAREDEKLWCDLLSSDKHNENMTPHYFFIMVRSGF